MDEAEDFDIFGAEEEGLEVGAVGEEADVGGIAVGLFDKGGLGDLGEDEIAIGEVGGGADEKEIALLDVLLLELFADHFEEVGGGGNHLFGENEGGDLGIGDDGEARF